MGIVHTVMAMLLSVMPFAFAMPFHLPVSMVAMTVPRSHQRLSAAQFLGTPLDFRDSRRIGAFPYAALRRLRKSGCCAQQQGQNYECDSVHLHENLSLVSSGMLSGKQVNWFLPSVQP